MTIQELYRWANHHNYEDLPIYIADESVGSIIEETEVSGMRFLEAEDEGEFSECCGAPRHHLFSESGLCSECKEHAEFSEGLPARIFLKS